MRTQAIWLAGSQGISSEIHNESLHTGHKEESNQAGDRNMYTVKILIDIWDELGKQPWFSRGEAIYMIQNRH